jgi:hypothetical protein
MFPGQNGSLAVRWQRGPDETPAGITRSAAGAPALWAVDGISTVSSRKASVLV